MQSRCKDYTKVRKILKALFVAYLPISYEVMGSCTTVTNAQLFWSLVSDEQDVYSSLYFLSGLQVVDSAPRIFWQAISKYFEIFHVPGQVYESHEAPLKCIPEAFCNTTCLTINGKEYKEGDRIMDETVCRTDCEVWWVVSLVCNIFMLYFSCPNWCLYH